MTDPGRISPATRPRAAVICPISTSPYVQEDGSIDAHGWRLACSEAIGSIPRRYPVHVRVYLGPLTATPYPLRDALAPGDPITYDPVIQPLADALKGRDATVEWRGGPGRRVSLALAYTAAWNGRGPHRD